MKLNIGALLVIVAAAVTETAAINHGHCERIHKENINLDENESKNFTVTISKGETLKCNTEGFIPAVVDQVDLELYVGGNKVDGSYNEHNNEEVEYGQVSVDTDVEVKVINTGIPIITADLMCQKTPCSQCNIFTMFVQIFMSLVGSDMYFCDMDYN